MDSKERSQRSAHNTGAVADDMSPADDLPLDEAPSLAESGSLAHHMATMGQNARAASEKLGLASTEQKRAALHAMAAHIRKATHAILEANAHDIARAKARGVRGSFIDRMMLDEGRIDAMAQGLEDIAGLSDPVGRTLTMWDRPNGLRIERVATPLGVIGVIFESRPNVTADAGGLCLMAGNAAILRSGSDALGSATAIHTAMAAGLETADLPVEAIQLVPVPDRDAVGHMLTGLCGSIDVIVPRGGRALVERVETEARVPVFAHLEGICHIVIDKAADPDMARDILVNAKMRRTSICGAAECALIDRHVPKKTIQDILGALIDAGCEIRGDDAVAALDDRVVPASDEDWGKEHLTAILSMRMVNDLDDAMSHIRKFGSQHTESIVTENDRAAERFLREVDSAIVMHNASTQFADGGEFGMGAEIGIATGRMHARGPVGVEQLTSFKYRVHGTGQTRA
jgi:glutamate-5-semialdehyde dehydrogenase